MPKICYTPKRFGAMSMAVVVACNEVIDDFMGQGYVLSLRQLYYQLVTKNAIVNELESYKRLGKVVSDARLAGLIDWEAIEDRERNVVKNSYWDDPEEIISAVAEQFTIDKWEGQENRVEIWVEKRALEAVVGQAAEKWDCPYFACKGYVSSSEMWRASLRFKNYARQEQNAVILHLGDHDPSGIDMTRDIEERINDVFVAPTKIERIALNWDQIQEYEPPPNPAKIKDSRFEAYAAEYGAESWEVDALSPSVLNELIEKHIQEYLDIDLWDQKVELEREGRALLQQVSDNWDNVVEGLTG